MSILHSYRWRKRIIISVIVVGLGVPLVWLGVHYSKSENPENANGPTVAGPPPTKNVPFTPAQRKQVHNVLKEFIATAVVRRNVGKSWDIAGPTLKEGITRKQWDKGNLPVIPYPAANKGWGNWSFVQYSYTEGKKHTVGVELYLFPKPKSGWSAMTADAEAVKTANGPWLVDYWMPKRFHGPPTASHTTKAKASAKTLRQRHTVKKKAEATANAKAQATPKAQASAPTQDAPHPTGVWWTIPLGLLGLAILLPVTIGAFFWYRNRKAQRDYVRSAGGNSGSNT